MKKYSILTLVCLLMGGCFLNKTQEKNAVENIKIKHSDKLLIDVRAVVLLSNAGKPVCNQEQINNYYRFSEQIWSDLKIQFVQTKKETLNMFFISFDCMSNDAKNNPKSLNIYFMEYIRGFGVSGFTENSPYRINGSNYIIIFIREPEYYAEHAAYTLSHEIGHQVFLLEHYWLEGPENKSCVSGYGSPWYTDNVMDYSGEFSQTVQPCQIDLARSNVYNSPPNYILGR